MHIDDTEQVYKDYFTVREENLGGKMMEDILAI